MTFTTAIPPKELKVEDITPRQGGMSVPALSARIRVTHLPTGILAECDARSQHKGKEICVEMIEAALTSPKRR